MRQYPVRRQIGQRRRRHSPLDAVDLVRHPESLADEAIQSRARHVGSPRSFPGPTDLSRDFLLPGLSRIEPARDQKQVLQGRFAGPRAQDSIGLAGLRRPADQGLEDLTPAVSRRRAVERRVEDLDAIAGTDVQDFPGL